MDVKVILDDNYHLTDEQLHQIKHLGQMSDDEIVYDEDCPEMTPVMEKAFMRAVQKRERMKLVDDYNERTKPYEPLKKSGLKLGDLVKYAELHNIPIRKLTKEEVEKFRV